MRTVWKYELAASEAQVIEMPGGAKPLHVDIERHLEGGRGVIERLVDPMFASDPAVIGALRLAAIGAADDATFREVARRLLEHAKPTDRNDEESVRLLLKEARLVAATDDEGGGK